MSIAPQPMPSAFWPLRHTLRSKSTMVL